MQNLAQILHLYAALLESKGSEDQDWEVDEEMSPTTADNQIWQQSIHMEST
jgi:hypothetical protein